VEAHRLQVLDQKSRDWLSAEDIAAVALSPLSENVRSLKGLAEDLASAAMGTPRGDAHTVVAKFLNRHPPDSGPVENPVAPPTPSGQRDELTSDQLLAALESTDWNRTPAARMLHVSRSTFLRWLRKYPELHRVADISIPELRREIEACGDDLDLVAKKLGTSVMLVRRRLGHRRGTTS
jgi:DNA-binding NtrC family response regulator